jgi:hypothetical protein
MPWPFTLGASVLALLPLWFWARAVRLRRLIQDLPTSKARGVFIGLVELKGTAEIEEPLTSYLAETACVQFAWSVSEEWRRVVTYTVTDKDGNSRTETRVESGWTTVASGGIASPFHLVDDTGSILVRPEGATIEGRAVFSETVTAFSDLYYGKGPSGGVIDSTGRRMFTESAVPLHAPVFVVGKARQREDVVAAEIAADPSAPMFLISTRSEDQVAGGHGWTIWLTGLLVLALPAGGWAVDRNQMGPADWPDLLPAGWFSLGAAVVLFLAWLWQVFNSMTDLRNRVRQAESLVDIQLKRRNDLIPELVRVVEAARSHEAGAHEALARLRAKAAGGQLTGLSGGIMGMAEAYPDLKANANFLSLQKELADTEQRIAMARDYLNDAITNANTRAERFPEGLVAGLAGIRRLPLLVTEGIERQPVRVNLAR